MNRLATRYFSNKQEKAVAETVGGRQTSNSGATAFDKGDVCTKEIMFECKTSMSDKNSYSIKKEVLEKVEKEKSQAGKTFSCLVFNFGPNRENYYVINEKFMQFVIDNFNKFLE